MSIAVVESSLKDLATGLSSKAISSVELTTLFLDRIDCPGEGGTWSTLEHVVAVAPGIITVAITAEPGASASGAWIDDAFLTVDRVNCPADLNEDGLVGDLDLDLLFGSWSSDGAACGCDLDANDVVDGADLGILMAAWGDCG